MLRGLWNCGRKNPRVVDFVSSILGLPSKEVSNPRAGVGGWSGQREDGRGTSPFRGGGKPVRRTGEMSVLSPQPPVVRAVAGGRATPVKGR